LWEANRSAIGGKHLGPQLRHSTNGTLRQTKNLFDITYLISYSLFIQSFPYELEYFVSDSGKAPFKQWLDDLRDISARARIRVRLDRLRLGNIGDSRSVGDGIFELRVYYGPGYRIYFGHEGKRIILLLLGGDKTTQERDVVQAKKFLDDYKRRRA
jgi:putative addiction module killer protein